MGPETSPQCPHCGSYLTERIVTDWDWVWLIAAAATFVMRLLLTFARNGEYRAEPGVYRCGTCGRTFTCLL